MLGLYIHIHVWITLNNMLLQYFFEEFPGFTMPCNYQKCDDCINKVLFLCYPYGDMINIIIIFIFYI